MENNNDLTFGSTPTNTVQNQTAHAHEQLAKDEQFVGVFFATILLTANKEKYNITSEKFAFTEYYKDTELYVSQRIFVRKLIDSPLFRDFMDYIDLLLNKSESSQRNGGVNKSPLDIFLDSFKKGDKAFLIRQIFRHTEQILEKYRFLQDFINISPDKIDIDNFHRGLWTLPIEQKILCATYVFANMIDEQLDEKETIYKIIHKQEEVSNEVVISSEEERHVYRFFNAFYIQFLLRKDFANTPILKLQFLEKYTDDHIYASQRIFIKDLISNPDFKIFCDEMKNLFLEYNETNALSPCALFLKRINKDVLIKQIFVQGIGKYKFLHPFVKMSGNTINCEDLNSKVWHLSQEQQIVIFAYIFSTLHDSNVKKRKLLKDSFTENCQRVQEYNKASGKGTQTEKENIDFFLKMLSVMNK